MERGEAADSLTLDPNAPVESRALWLKAATLHLLAAQQCNAEAQRCQAEARRAHLLAAVEDIAELERRIGMNSELAVEMRRLR